MLKTIFTLNVDDYAPEITALTYPFMRRYAKKIGAEFRIIDKRRSPNLSPTYEKLQIFELGRDSDWIIYFDSDVLIHPDMFDVTDHLQRDTVMHNAYDMAGNRWRYDDYFRRDGRHIGSCNWFTVASRWCLDLWHRPDDLFYWEAVESIFPIDAEQRKGITAEHLIDDYILSRNIARYGLKFLSFRDLLVKLGRPTDRYLWHEYTTTTEEKAKCIRSIMVQWNLTESATELVGAHV